MRKEYEQSVAVKVPDGSGNWLQGKASNAGRGWTERVGEAYLGIQAYRLYWVYTNSRLSLESEFSE